jgi:hypothetical protein
MVVRYAIYCWLQSLVAESPMAFAEDGHIKTAIHNRPLTAITFSICAFLHEWIRGKELDRSESTAPM